MKFVLLIIIVFICAYIGYGLSNYYNKRVNFFKDLKLLFEKIKLEINFSHLKLISILNSFSTTSKEVDYLKKNFKKCLQENLNFNEENLFCNIKILSNDEKQLLILFLTSLGKFDVFNQSKQLENQEKELELLRKNAEDEAKKYGPLYLKLGVILGLAIALIFL